MIDFRGRTIVVRIDAGAARASAFVGDLDFLLQRGLRPIIVAPDSELARRFVGLMNRSGDAAVGLRGADAGMIPAAGETIGCIQPRLLETLTRSGYVPVIEPTAIGLLGDVELHADDVASAIGRAMDAVRVVFFHESGGIVDAKTQQMIDELTPAEALALAESQTLSPDVCSMVRAAALGVRGGVGAAQIVDGRIAHAAIVEFVTLRHLGTQVAGTVFIA